MFSSLFRRDASPPLTEEEALAQFRTVLNSNESCNTSPAKEWLTDDCLLRFLRARSLSVPKATEMILETIAWRASYRPNSLFAEYPDSLQKEASSGKMFVLPCTDRSGNAVIVMRPGLENSSDVDSNIRYLVYTLERASALSKSGKFTVIVDYFTGNISVSTSPSFSVMKQTNSILQNHFPERLGACFFYDAPGFFTALLTMLKPFIDPVTRDKIFFAKSATATDNEDCKRLLDLENTPQAYGGTLNYDFDVKEYFALDQRT